MTGDLTAPPHSEKAEDAIIGIVLRNQDALQDIELREEVFYSQQNKNIWAAIQEMSLRGEAIDHITVAKHLSDSGVGIQSEILDKFLVLNDEHHITANAGEYCAILNDNYQCRREILILSDGEARAFEGESVSADVMGKLSEVCVKDDPTLSMDEHAENFVEDCIAGNVGNFHWWCHDWTYKLGRITSDLIILHAPRSTGKTALMMQWICEAHKIEQRVPLASIEMLRKELAPRLMAHLGQVSTFVMRTRGSVTMDEESKARSSIKELRALELCIRDKAMTIGDICTWAIREKNRGGADAIFVDNLLSISDGGKAYQSKTIMYDDFIRKFRDLRDQLKIPIIILAHPNAEGGIAWSKDVENFADIILYLKDVPSEGIGMKGSGKVLMPNGSVKGKHVAAIFQKNRNGVCFTASLDFVGSTQTFEHLSWEDV